MSRNYSIQSFFRQMPNNLLARYFSTRGLLADFDFTTLKKRNFDALMLAWGKLTDDQRLSAEGDFREIFDMSCENGLRSIIDEAKYHLAAPQQDSCADAATSTLALAAFSAKLLALPGHFERAMVTFLDHQNLWSGATQFHHADSLRYWRKRKDLPKVAPAVDPDSLQRLEAEIRAYFMDTEWRGRYSRSEVLRRGDHEYYFVYLEDHPRKDPEWLAGELTPRRHIPATEIVFVYNSKEGTLDINARGLSKAAQSLQDIFTLVILNNGSPLAPSADPVYDLNPLRRRDFAFVIPLGSRIEAVWVRKLTLASTSVAHNQLTLQSGGRRNPLGIYDLLAEVEANGPLPNYKVSHAELVAQVSTPKRRPKFVSVRIASPSSCSLQHEDVDRELRAMLQASGIEPRERQKRPAPRAALAAESATAETAPAAS